MKKKLAFPSEFGQFAIFDVRKWVVSPRMLLRNGPVILRMEFELQSICQKVQAMALHRFGLELWLRLY